MTLRRPLAWFVMSYAVVLLIPIVLGTALFFTAVRVAEEDARLHNTAFLSLVREMVDSRLREVVQLSGQIAENPRLNDFLQVRKPFDTDARLLEKLVIGELGGFSDIASAADDFYLYLPGADVILTPNSAYDSRLYFHAVQKYRPISYEEWIASLTDPLRLRRFVPLDTGSAVLPFRSALGYIQTLPVDYGKEPAAFLVMLIDTGTIIGYLEETDRHDGTAISVIDSSDRVVFSTAAPVGIPIRYAGMPEETGMAVMKRGTQRFAVFYTTSRESSWKYAAVVPESVFLERARYIGNTAAAVFAACLAFGLVVVAVLAYRSYRPYRDVLDENRAMRGQVMENHGIIVNTLLLQLLRDTKGKGDFILRSLERYGISLPREGIRVAALRTAAKDAATGLLENAETETGRPVAPVVEWNEKILAVLLPRGGDGRPAEDLLRNVVGLLRAKGDEEAVAGIGPACGRADELPLSFREALDALTSADVDDEIVAVASRTEPADSSYEYPLQTENEFINAMRAGDFPKAGEIVERVFDENLRRRKLPEGLLRCLMFDMVSSIVKVREHLGVLRQAEDADPLIALVSAGSFREFKAGFTDAVRKTCEKASLRKKSHNERLKDDLRAFIGERFTDNLLSVSAIAEHFHLSPAYLSHFFKEQAGCNLLDHINRLRVDRVMELLADRSLTLSKVARLSGFSNDIVLNRVFKKYKGLAPGHFREELSNDRTG